MSDESPIADDIEEFQAYLRTLGDAELQRKCDRSCREYEKARALVRQVGREMMTIVAEIGDRQRHAGSDVNTEPKP